MRIEPERLDTAHSAGPQGAVAVVVDHPSRQPCPAQSTDGLKVGGHQASSASLANIMSALYFSRAAPAGPRRGQAAREPGVSRHPVSVRPPDPRRSWRISAATRARNPIRRAPRMPTTSISPPARSVSASRRRCSPRWCRTTSRAHGWMKDRPEGRMIALVGDAEMDEGNIFEALLEGWKHGLRNTWWVVDYNRRVARCRGARRAVGQVRDHVPQFRLGRGDREIRQA